MKYKITLNKKVYEVEVEQGEAILLDEYEAAAPVAAPAPAVSAPAAVPAAAAAVSGAAVSGAAGEPVLSPLPGAIVDVKVKVGQQIKVGDVAMTIEAMKMENDIIAPKTGIVTEVAVSKGASVSTDELLFKIG